MRKLLTLALAATAALAVTAPAADAATMTVTSGKLEWTMANYYASGDAARTWLGYITDSGVGPQFSNGTAAVTSPATLTGPDGLAAAAINGTSARTADQKYTFGYPVAAAGGTYSDAGVGTIETEGTASFTTHTLPITVINPLITLNGLTGTLKATGVAATMAGATAPYDRSVTQFTLDLSAATVTLRADGSRVIDGIIPVSTADTATSGFGPGSRRYGTMKLTLGLAYPEPGTGPKGDTGASVLGSPGATGPAGPQGPAGPAGKNGTSAKISTFTLKKAPFAGTAKRSVKLLQRKTGKVLATGTLQGRKLRVSALTTTKLKGSFVVKVANGTRRATITLK